MNARRLLGLLISVSTAPAATYAATFVYGNASGWTVRTDPEQGYRCFADVQYEGGTLIRVGFEPNDAGWYVSLSDPALIAFSDGVERTAQVSFDGEPPLDLAAIGTSIDPDGPLRGIRLAIPSEAQQSFMSDFMTKYTLQVAIEDREALDLSLTGSHRAINMLEDCRAAMARARSSN